MVASPAELLDGPLRREALPPVATFLAVVAAGVGGFATLADVGVVEAAFWLLDPTSIELHYAEHGGAPHERLTKAYALLVVSALVLASVWTGETVLQAAFGGQIREELHRVRTERELAAVDDHVVVCGYGMFGRTVADHLVANGRAVAVVEHDDDQLERVPEDVYGIDGDARREQTLERAGVERAAAVVAAIDDSNVNIQTAIVARDLAPDARLIVRVGDEMYEELARQAGADEVVIPEVVSGDRVGDVL